MKTIAVKIENELHKQLKLYAVNQGETVTSIVTKLISKELKSKKEQTQ